MRSRAIAVIPVLLLLAGGPLAGQGKKGKKEPPPPDYYPLKVGHTWEYRVGKQKVVVTVRKEEAADKDTITEVETREGDKTTVKERVAVLKDGVYRLTEEGMDVTPPLCFLKLPFKAGESWSVKSRFGGQAVTGTFTAGEENVTVQAGKFKAVTSTCPDFQIGKYRMAVKYWFAPGVGMVKQSLQLGDRTVLVELEKFIPAK